MQWMKKAALTILLTSLQVLVNSADEFRLGSSIVSSTGASGYLEVDHGSDWHTVCSNGLSEEVLSVLCRQTGHGNFLRWSTEKRKKKQTEVFLEISAICSGTEKLITDCKDYDLTQASTNSLCVIRSIRKMICDATGERSNPESSYRNLFVGGNHDLLYNLAESLGGDMKESSNVKYDVNVINLNDDSEQNLGVISKDELNYKHQIASDQDEIKPMHEKKDEIEEFELARMDSSTSFTTQHEIINVVRRTRSMEGWATNDDMDTEVTTLRSNTGWNYDDVTTRRDHQTTKKPQLISQDKNWSIEDDREPTTAVEMDTVYGRIDTTTIEARTNQRDYSLITDSYESVSNPYSDFSSSAKDLSSAILDLTTEMVSTMETTTQVLKAEDKTASIQNFTDVIFETLTSTQAIGNEDAHERTTEHKPVTSNFIHKLTQPPSTPYMGVQNTASTQQSSESSMPNLTQTYQTFASPSPSSHQPVMNSSRRSPKLSATITLSKQDVKSSFSVTTPLSATPTAKSPPSPPKGPTTTPTTLLKGSQMSTTTPSSEIVLDEGQFIEVPKWGIGVQRITGVNQVPTAAQQVLLTPKTPAPYPEFIDKPFKLETLAPAKEKIGEQEYEVGNQGDSGNGLNPDGPTKEYTWVQSCSHFWHTVNGTNQLGVIQSPKYPNPYPAAESCKWMLVSDLSQTVTIDIIDLDMRQGIDVLSIITKVNGAFSHVYNLTGDLAGVPKATFLLNSTLIYLEFTTSNYVNNLHRGFQVRYTLNSLDFITDGDDRPFHHHLSFRVILILAAICLLLLIIIVSIFTFWRKDIQRKRQVAPRFSIPPVAKASKSCQSGSVRRITPAPSYAETMVTPFKSVPSPSVLDMTMHKPQAFPEHIIEVNSLREKPALPNGDVTYDDTTFVFMKRQRFKQPKSVVQPVPSYNSPKIMTPRTARRNHGLLGMLRSGSKIFPRENTTEVREAISHTPIEVLDGQTPCLDRIEDGFGAFLSNETYTVNMARAGCEAPAVKDNIPKSVTLREIRQEKKAKEDYVQHRNIKPDKFTQPSEKNNSKLKIEKLNLDSLDLVDENIEEVNDLRGTYTIKKDRKNIEVKKPPLTKTISPALPRKGSKIPIVTPRTDKKNQQISTISSGAYHVNTNVAGKISVASKRGDWSTPGEFMCQLSGKVMENPVRADDGFTYEKSVIVDWLQAQSSSPMTNRKITKQGLKLDAILRGRIQRWRLKQRGDNIQMQSQAKKASENILCDIED